MEDELGDVSGNICEWNVIENGVDGRCISIMINAGAGKPTNKKAYNSANNSGIEPKRWLGEILATQYNIDDNRGEKCEWGNSGRHAKNNTQNKHNYGKKHRGVLFDWMFGDELGIWNTENKSNEREGDIIVNHGEFTVEGVAEWRNDESNKECTKD